MTSKIDTASCENCSAAGIKTPGKIWAPWYDAENKTDGTKHLICFECLRAGSFDGPGYRMAAHVFDLEHAIDEAQGRWRGADWQHELRRDGAIVRSDDGETPVYCNGEVDGCETCIDARVDSETAECYARWAAQAARRGDLARVSAFLERARDLEAAYGDAPTWGPVAELAERLRAEQGGEQ